MINLPFKNKGFALLYAVLLTGIILAIGLGLSAIIAKQIVLSSTGAASQAAYYAANTGKECILNWGIHGGRDDDQNFLTAFGGYVLVPNDEGTADVLSYQRGSPYLDNINCGEGDISVPAEPDTEEDDNGNELKVFNLNEFEINGNCIEVSVILSETQSKSEVRSTGYNLPCDQVGNARRVERQIVGFGEFATPF